VSSNEGESTVPESDKGDNSAWTLSKV